MADIPGGQGHVVPMHRTQSIDYIMMMSGQIVCELDCGVEKLLETGDLVVQKGTNHRWVNWTEQNCRVLFVMVAADKIVLGEGRVLEETVIKK